MNSHQNCQLSLHNPIWFLFSVYGCNAASIISLGCLIKLMVTSFEGFFCPLIDIFFHTSNQLTIALFYKWSQPH